MAKRKESDFQAEAKNFLNGLFLKRPAVPFKLQGTREEQKRMTMIIDEVANNSPFAKEILEKAANAGYTLSLTHLGNAVGSTNGNAKTIMLQESASSEKLMSTLIHESRHAQQYENGVDYEFFSLNVKSEIMVRRAMEADACACAAFGVTQMKENGMGGAYFTYSDEKPDLFKSLEEGRKQGGDKGALRGAFDAWYKDTNQKAAYENLYLTQPMRRAEHDWNFMFMDFYKDVKSEDVIDKICAFGDTRYFDGKVTLEDKKYLEISERTKEIADKFFKLREDMQFTKPDKSYEELPTRQASMSESLTMVLNGFGELDLPQESKKEKIMENKKRFMKAQAPKKNVSALARAAAMKKQNAR